MGEKSFNGDKTKRTVGVAFNDDGFRECHWRILFLGSSVAIHAAGPSILLSYILSGILVYLILYALSEMTVADPTVGSFSNFAARELGQGFGFVVGWLYWTGTVLSMSSEATAITILLRKWFPHLSIAFLEAF